MSLAIPIRHPKFLRRVLLKVGFELTNEAIDRLREMHIRMIWVKYPGLDYLDEMINPKVMETQGELVESISATFNQVEKQASAKISFASYTKSITELIESLVTNPKSAVFLGDIASGDGGADLMRHSSTVTYLSLLMGLKLDGYLIRQRKHIDPSRAKEVMSLGMGAMLHDVGIAQLSAEVRERYQETGNENDPAWREHPYLGYQLVRGSVEPSAATVVLNHHQRFDGSGYAGKDATLLDGQRIHIFARIVGLAEQFDRIRNPPNLPPQPTVFALGALLHEPLFAKFDPEVIRALLTVVPPYAPGTMLKLSDGRWAVAVDHVPSDPCRPIVQITPDPKHMSPNDAGEVGDIIELTNASPSLYVVEADGQDTSELNFERPALMQEELSSSMR